MFEPAPFLKVAAVYEVFDAKFHEIAFFDEREVSHVVEEQNFGV